MIGSHEGWGLVPDYILAPTHQRSLAVSGTQTLPVLHCVIVCRLVHRFPLLLLLYKET